jgi:hypothetical protein
VVVRRRRLLLYLAARAIKRVANAPSPNAAFAVPYLVKASVIDHAGFQQLNRTVLDFSVVQYPRQELHKREGGTAPRPIGEDQ